MKYIPADKLIAEIDKKWKELADKNVKVGGGKYDIEIFTYLSVKNLITSLQQEQPKFKVGDTIHKKGENTVFPMVIERISDGDYVCDNAHSFINIKYQDDYELVQQEQPEVDLKKEVSNYLKMHHLHIKDGGRVVFDNDDSPNFMFDITDIARHFYELGRARKDE